jgi:hypothetical protein
MMRRHAALISLTNSRKVPTFLRLNWSMSRGIAGCSSSSPSIGPGCPDYSLLTLSDTADIF